MSRGSAPGFPGIAAGQVNAGLRAKGPWENIRHCETPTHIQDVKAAWRDQMVRAMDTNLIAVPGPALDA